MSACARRAGVWLFGGKDRLSDFAERRWLCRLAPPIDLREGEGKKKTARLMLVAAACKTDVRRRVLISFGTRPPMRSALPRAKGKRTAARARGIRRESHRRELCRDCDDDGTAGALLRFLDAWRPDDFARLGWPEEMKDQNIVFSLESEQAEETSAFMTAPPRGRCGRGSAPRARRAKPPASSPASAARSRGCIRRSKACGARNRRAPRSSPSISTPSPPMATSRAITPGLGGGRLRLHDGAEPLPRKGQRPSRPDRRRLDRLLGRRLRRKGCRGGGRHCSPLCSARTRSMKAFEAKKVGAILQAVREGRPIAISRPTCRRACASSCSASRPMRRGFRCASISRTISGRSRHAFSRMWRECASSRRRETNGRPSGGCSIETAVQRKSENVPPNLAGEWLRAILTGALLSADAALHPSHAAARRP